MCCALSAWACGADQSLATEWIDADTGHRVIRLSSEPGSLSLYFHQNAYTPDGKKLIITTPSGIAAVDLQTRAVELIVQGKARPIIVGYRTNTIYYTREGAIFATDVYTRATRQIAPIPPGGSVNSVNADETLIAGTITYGPDGSTPGATSAPANLTKAQRIDWRYNQHLPMELFTINTATGELKRFHRCKHWLNHVQFSPTDPNLLLFCHEGPWHKVDRTWTIRTDGSGLTMIHPRTMAMEIEGHEWFSADGKTVWYDLQTPRGQVFWVAGYELETGRRTWYSLQRDEWSVHFVSSPDGKLFAGDGGSEGMVARARDGKWIYLFRPELLEDRGPPDVDSSRLIRPGILRSERLVNMSRHDYALEPNVTFTPDMKWIVFRSNMLGPSHVFAVEIAKAGS
ncbi:oligogalacturonate lyase family protein [Fontivita pretiosa]|uniref:oligogalacturonate lyase family protein n=1 Tax=Fontivita pretiosa TaxID=2989684 RepID=UPI003D16477F